MPVPAAAGFAVVGGLQLINGFQQAGLIRAQASLNQEIAEFNASLADVDAYEAEKFGFTETARYETMVSNVLSDQKLAFAAQGVDANYGTAADIQKESRLNGFLNTLDIQSQARARARGFRSEARNLRLGAANIGAQGNINASATVGSAVLNAAATGAKYYTQK